MLTYLTRKPVLCLVREGGTSLALEEAFTSQQTRKKP